MKELSETRTESHPDIGWSEVAKFRDLIAHHYWYIDPARVWDTIGRELGPLETAIRAELALLPP